MLKTVFSLVGTAQKQATGYVGVNKILYATQLLDEIQKEGLLQGGEVNTGIDFVADVVLGPTGNVLVTGSNFYHNNVREESVCKLQRET